MPGQFTKVKLLLDVVENAVVIPQKSIIIEKGGAFVYVMKEDSIVERRMVEVSVNFENQVVIERGIWENEDVVIEGQHKLSPGIKVLPVALSDTVKVNQKIQEETE